MKVVEKYKQTEVGLIPSDWEVRELGGIAEFYNGKAHEQDIDENGNYIVVNSKFISTNGEIYKSSRLAHFPLQQGDITMVMSDIPNGKALAKCYFIKQDKKYTLNQRICSLKANICDSKYLFYTLNRNKYFLSFDSGSGQTNLRRNEVLECPIPLPPTKAEQTAIANALSDADALISSLEKLIAKKRNIKQGAMQQLLQPKEGWEVKKLGDFLDYEQPTEYLVSDTDYNDNNQTPVLTAGKTFILGYTNEEFGIFNKLPVIIFDDFTTAIKYVDFPFKAKSSAMKMLIPKNEKVNLRFIYEIMLQIKYQVSDHKRHWIGEFSKLEILVPPTAVEQTRIATILSDMDAEIAALETKLEKYRKVKLGMMQNLLTGKIRLV